MRVNLHIERLVLDGLPIGASQGAAVQRAVEMELVRLLGEQGPRVSEGGAVDRVAGGEIRVGNEGPARLGGQIAEAVHRSVTS